MFAAYASTMALATRLALYSAALARDPAILSGNWSPSTNSMSMAAHQLPKNSRLEPRSAQKCEPPSAPKRRAMAASTRMRNHGKPCDMANLKATSAQGQRADADEQAEHGRAQIEGDIGQIHRSGREWLEMH